MIEIDRIDHIVLTVIDLEITTSFYERVLGCRRVEFGAGRVALHFGRQKINLHRIGGDVSLVANDPRPGSADLCFVTTISMEAVVSHLANVGIDVIEGPVARTGALGEMQSVYFRDPDGNLIEVSRYE